jgi:hypothetical protein
MEKEVNEILPEDTKCPTISKSGDVWTFSSSTTILVSSQQADKEHMLRLIQQWKDRNV